jgi:hypothetical protein
LATGLEESNGHQNTVASIKIMKNNSARPILLGDYLSAKGPVKALMNAECTIFGIPTPLQNGWVKKHQALEITPAMISAVRKYIEGKDSPAAKKTRAALTILDGTSTKAEPAPPMQLNMDVPDWEDQPRQAADRLPPWEADSQCNQPTIDYVRRLLARCERGEVIGVTVIEHLPDGRQVAGDANWRPE